MIAYLLWGHIKIRDLGDRIQSCPQLLWIDVAIDILDETSAVRWFLILLGRFRMLAIVTAGNGRPLVGLAAFCG